jgi:hypothetical protein
MRLPLGTTSASTALIAGLLFEELPDRPLPKAAVGLLAVGGEPGHQASPLAIAEADAHDGRIAVDERLTDRRTAATLRVVVAHDVRHE